MCGKFKVHFKSNDAFSVGFDARYGNGGGDTPGEIEWLNILNKPFSIIGDNLVVINDALTVDIATDVEEDNTRPITSAAVYTEIGNIEAVLALI